MNVPSLDQKTTLVQANSLLSIAIPTYNRADFLDYCLEIHIALARAHNIQIFISDNASTDSTSDVVCKWTKEYPLIRYYRNNSNLGPDENFERALKYPDTQYVWLLGDTYKIPSEGIEYVLELISVHKEKFDAIVVNKEKYDAIASTVAGRVIDIPEQDYNDQNKLLSDLGWHMTCLASLIYSSKLIACADFKRYRNTNFIQMGAIFEYIANKEFIVHWTGNFSIQMISIKDRRKISWQDQAFDIWTNRWANFIFSLPPSYRLDVKLKCTKDHGIKSGLFSFSSMLKLRSNNALNLNIFLQYLPFLPFTIKSSKSTILSIALLPRCISRTLRSIIKTSNRYFRLLNMD